MQARIKGQSIEALDLEERSKKAPTVREQVFMLLDANPGLSARELAVRTQRSTRTMQMHRDDYFILYPEKRPPKPMSKLEQSVRAQLAENRVDVELDRPFGDRQAGRNLLGR